MDKFAAEHVHRVANMGVEYYDVLELRRIAMTLQRWFEQECGNSDNYKSWAIERDDETDKPYMCIYPHTDGRNHRYQIADRENGAKKRLAKIMAKYPHLTYYVQTDPRGNPLYIIPKDKLDGRPVDQWYNSFGISLFK